MFPGKPVVGYDGEPVGVWLAGNEEAMRVRLQDGRVTWLRGDAVLDASEEEVVLICYASGINRWLRSQ